MYRLIGDDVRPDLFYLAHPRTASVATKQALGSVGAVEQVTSHHGLDTTRILQGALVFTTVRNPWDVFVSWWFKRQIERSPFYGKPLEEFIPSLIQNNGRYFKGGKMFYMADHATVILHYEQLQSQFDTLLVQVGYPPTELVTVNQSTRSSSDYREHYTPATRQWVAEHFAAEIERYGYHF
jgi:hypothetical protein